MPFDIDKQMESFQRIMTPGSERLGSAPMNQIGAYKPRVQKENYMGQSIDADRADVHTYSPMHLAKKGEIGVEDRLARDFRIMGDSPINASKYASRAMDIMSRRPQKYTPPQSEAIPPAASTPKVAPQWAYTAAEPYAPPLTAENGSKMAAPSGSPLTAENGSKTVAPSPEPLTAENGSKMAAPSFPPLTAENGSKTVAPSTDTESFKHSFDIDSRMKQWDAANKAQHADDIESILKSYAEAARSRFARESDGKTSADPNAAADTGHPAPKEDPDIPKGTTTVAERFTMDSNGNMVLPNDSSEDYAARNPKSIKRVQSE